MHHRIITLLFANCAFLSAHETAPDPVLFYNFTRQHLISPQVTEPNTTPATAAPTRLKSQFGPELVLGATPIEEASASAGLRFAKIPTPHRVDVIQEQLPNFRPTTDFTISSWFTLDEPQPFGALISSISSGSGKAAGLALGYQEFTPIVALATRRAKDGAEKLTILKGNQRLTPGLWHHLAATYDGTELRLFLDGQPIASTLKQNGEILWPEQSPLWIGGLRDKEQSFPHRGRIGDVKVFTHCANATWIAKEFQRGTHLRKLPGEVAPGDTPAVIVPPYLQWVRGDQATIMWETNFPCQGTLAWSKSPDCTTIIQEPVPARLHQITLKGLEPEMLYYFKTISSTSPKNLETPLQTFQTAPKQGSPFAFVVFCDTQANPDKLKQLALAAWELRPHFVMIGGDLVTTGTDKSHWTKHFFPHMRPLIDSVPFYPVLGNHEQNSMHYYDYVKLPKPEYYYTFKQGDIQFFMLDSNKDLRPGSEQYRWLDRELAASTSLWKICMHHHPPFSSDDDYGNDWKHPLADMTLGDPAAKPIVHLYDKYAVDIVWCGHIHSYERTWMIRNGKPVKKDGTTYLITGGAGGGLETFGPYRPPFQRHIKTGHHFTYVTSFGGQLDMKAYDIEGRMFDHFVLEKEKSDKK